ncbi:MAG: carboxypeptidase regulatory-like domain-containing protein [Pyrinomonadaceae bacterium]|nr:carboxypeptidase regulatory-like domain-containing protein [Pyrinomonadaceae bacterium]
MKNFLTGLMLVLVFTIGAVAQTTTGRLSGTVSTADGVLPGATVTATDNTTGREQTTVTNGEGYYAFTQLEFGTYTVKISNAGFKTYVGNEVKIDVGREYTLNQKLEIGDISETVVVTAGADVITSGSAQVSNTVSPEQILSLPLITRNPLSLTTLQAGVQSNSAQGTTINGMRTSMTNITRDGINIQDTFIRSNATDFAPGRPSVDDTGEFTIATSNAEADQGYGGAQIRLVTPRGTKDFRGALYAYNRNSAFAANSFFNNRTPNNADGSQADAAKKPSYRNRNQFGGKISGPVPVPGFGEGTPMFFKDKGFFFFAYEKIKDPVSSAATRTILTPSARSGAFQYNRATAGAAIATNVGGASVSCPAWTGPPAPAPVCTISDILAYARATVTNGSTLPSSISGVINNRVLSALPTSSNFAGGDGLNTAGFRLLRGSDQERDQYSTRIDVDFNEKSSLSGIFNYNEELNLRPDADTTKFTTTPGVTQSSTNKQFTMAYRRTITSNFLTEFRGGVFTSEVPFDRTDAIPEYFLALPLVTFPENTFMSQGRNTKGFNYQSNSDYVMGNHTFRFGGQLQYFKVNAYNDAGINPTITVGTGSATPSFSTANFAAAGGISTAQNSTANGLLALLGGLYTTAAQSFNVNSISEGYSASRPIEPLRYQNHSLFFSDRWLATKGLTLSLGVRYEIFPAMSITNGLALEPVIDDLSNPINSLLNTQGFTNLIGGNSGKPNTYYKTDWNNFAPNFGIAWSPDFESGIGKFLFGASGKSVLRGGYSHAYGNDSIVTSIRNAANGNPGLARSTFSLINQNGRLDAGVPTVTPPAFTAPPRSYLLNNQQANFFGTIFAIDPNIKIPRIEQYSFGIQREFFGNTAFEIRYVGTRSKNLARGIDVNQVDIFNNGFLNDFNRAASNLAINTAERNARIAACVSGGGTTASCTTTVNSQLPLSAGYNPALAGSVQLTLFPLLGTLSGTSGGVGSATAAINSTVASNLNNGTPADLAIVYINSSANLNGHPTPASPFAVPRINFLPSPAGGAIDVHLNDGFYSYNSLQMEVRRRFSNGLYFQANYTFSKNLTNAVGTSQALFEPFLDNNNKELDKQRADYDQTHVFSFNGIYQLPFGKGKMFLNNGGIVDKVFGGWELSGLAQWTSGAPISFVDSRGTLNRSGRSGRQTPNSTLSYDEIRALTGIFEANGNIYWFNPSVICSNGAASTGFGATPCAGQSFFNVNPGQTGALGRALIDGPRYFNINAALLKNIRFGETMRVQLRAEAFNLLNNVNFIQNTQFANINSTSFGRITSDFGPRQMQFAVRFEF